MHNPKSLALPAVALRLIVTGLVAIGPPVTIAASEQDPATSILFWPADRQIDGYRTIANQFPTRQVAASPTPLPLPRAARQLDADAIAWDSQGKSVTLSQWLNQDRMPGAIVVRSGEVLHESYRFGNTAESRWISFSVSKSLTSMLIGAALRDGFIRSVNDPVTDYLPLLKGSSYDGVSIRDVLQMSSGVVWDENYSDPGSDVSRAGGLNGLPLVRYMRQLGRAAPPGKKFNYNTGETNLAGAVLRAAIGNNASEYLTYRIWQPFGMEHSAQWLLAAPGGGELGGCCLNATLRDYARIGLFAMNGGRLQDGTPVLADGWMQESTTPAPSYDGYGYLWWLADDGTYEALGIFGQMIHIDPRRKLVIAFHGAWEIADGGAPERRRYNAVRAIVKAVDQL